MSLLFPFQFESSLSFVSRLQIIHKESEPNLQSNSSFLSYCNEKYIPEPIILNMCTTSGNYCVTPGVSTCDPQTFRDIERKPEKRRKKIWNRAMAFEVSKYNQSQHGKTRGEWWMLSTYHCVCVWILQSHWNPTRDVFSSVFYLHKINAADWCYPFSWWIIVAPF